MLCIEWNISGGLSLPTLALNKNPYLYENKLNYRRNLIKQNFCDMSDTAQPLPFSDLWIRLGLKVQAAVIQDVPCWIWNIPDFYYNLSNPIYTRQHT